MCTRATICSVDLKSRCLSRGHGIGYLTTVHQEFVKTAHRYHTIEIQAGRQTITTADPPTGDLRQALEAITRDN